MFIGPGPDLATKWKYYLSWLENEVLRQKKKKNKKHLKPIGGFNLTLTFTFVEAIFKCSILSQNLIEFFFSFARTLNRQSKGEGISAFHLDRPRWIAMSKWKRGRGQRTNPIGVCVCEWEWMHVKVRVKKKDLCV